MMGWFRRRHLAPSSADASAMVIGLIDATVCLAQILVSAGLLSREQLSAAYVAAAEQQSTQTGVDTERRTLATRAISAFFAAPIIGDKPGLKLVVDNDRSKTVP